MIKTAFLLAAGYGTRLQPWTHLYAKPLLSLGKKPVLFRHLDQLIAFGMDHILINLHHKKHQLQSFIEFYMDRVDPLKKIKVTFLEEDPILGTGGALFQVKMWVKEDHFFLINSDIVHEENLAFVAEFHEQHGNLATLVVKETTNAKDVVMNSKGEVIRLANISLKETQNEIPVYTFSGIHIIHKRIFQYVKEKRFQCIVRDIYPLACKNQEILMALKTPHYWMDMGDTDKYAQVQKDWLERKFI